MFLQTPLAFKVEKFQLKDLMIAARLSLLLSVKFTHNKAQIVQLACKITISFHYTFHRLMSSCMSGFSCSQLYEKCMVTHANTNHFHGCMCLQDVGHLSGSYTGYPGQEVWSVRSSSRSQLCCGTNVVNMRCRLAWPFGQEYHSKRFSVRTWSRSCDVYPWEAVATCMRSLEMSFSAFLVLSAFIIFF